MCLCQADGQICETKLIMQNFSGASHTTSEPIRVPSSAEVAANKKAGKNPLEPHTASLKQTGVS